MHLCSAILMYVSSTEGIFRPSVQKQGPRFGQFVESFTRILKKEKEKKEQFYQTFRGLGKDRGWRRMHRKQQPNRSSELLLTTRRAYNEMN